jgi:Putative MetA-pathway of phenol degradation
MRICVRTTLWIGLTMLAGITPKAACAQILETETARFLERGTTETGTGFEFQTSSEGTERALPFTIEHAVSDRLALLIEPVAWTAIRPNHGVRAAGVGDLEVTGLVLLSAEQTHWPALAFGLEAKLPTARNTLIGTGRTDVAGYLITSQRHGGLDLHANLGYTIPGQPPGARLMNTWSGALAAEFRRGSSEWYGEVLANTSSSPEGGDNAVPTGQVVPEASGGELVGTIGWGIQPTPDLLLSLGISYDNNQAWQFRPGVTFRLP